MNPRIAMIFLCAGASSRMGRSKALLPWGETSILEHHWTLFQSLEHYDPWIVMQKSDTPLFAELDRIEWRDAQRVVNRLAPECDMLDSIRCGISACLAQHYRSIGIALIDQPLIQRETFQALAEAEDQQPSRIHQPSHQGRRGHPVILPRAVAEELLSSPAESLKAFLSGKEAVRTVLDVGDAGILTDLDTPGEYSKHKPQLALGGCL